ncbi:hypothetical protein EDB85DRAFT_2154025 [Lactarius pseudohatsudake]|nr:hypothetical protein EDB85DRAFT_2154025 [Lactarius pseudohatsudake]
MSAPPYLRETGAHEDKGCAGPSPVFEHHSPSVQATPAQPHTPCPALPAYARGGMVRPPLCADHASPTPCALPCPRTQEDGRRVQPSPAHAPKGRAQSSSARATPAQPHAPRPALPAFARGGDGAPTPPRWPRQPSPLPPAHATGRVGTSTPPRGLRQPGVYAPRHAGAPPGMQEGRAPSPPGLHAAPKKRCVQGGGPHAREGVHGTRADVTRAQAASGGVARKVCGRGGAERNPGGGAAHEQKGRHIGAWVRKGESDGEGVVNEAKRSRGEAARANGRHPPHQ